MRGAESRHVCRVRALWEAHARAARGGSTAFACGTSRRDLPTLPEDLAGWQQVLRILRGAYDGTPAGHRQAR
jgi:hypothetical protein